MNYMFEIIDVAPSELRNYVLDLATLGFTQCLFISLFQSFEKSGKVKSFSLPVL